MLRFMESVSPTVFTADRIRKKFCLRRKSGPLNRILLCRERQSRRLLLRSRKSSRKQLRRLPKLSERSQMRDRTRMQRRRRRL